MKNRTDTYVILGVFAVASVLLALPMAPFRQSFDGAINKYIGLNVTLPEVLFPQYMSSAHHIAATCESEFSDIPLIDNLNR
jgi:hypothetical protein